MRLAPDIHMAESDGRIIFLDVRRDTYGAASAEQARALRERRGDDPQLALLVAEGLLDDDGGPWEVAACRWPRPVGELDAAPRARAADGLRALLAIARADLRLPRRPLSELIAMPLPIAAPAPADVAAFAAVRGWYPRRRACLFDAYALLELLRRGGTRPNWVFGVRGVPFAAHCWLEADGIVLNDRLENVLPFTPIMVA